MTTTNYRTCSKGAAIGLLKLVALAGATYQLNGAVPTPVLELRFSEGSGITTANSGSLGGVGDLALANDQPSFSTNIPAGLYAPAGNTRSIDFGAIGDGQGGQAIDVNTDVGSLGAFTAFTISGWLNPRSLTVGAGGNRVLYALESPGGSGIDLVQLANGSLRIGINQWPDAGTGGPASSAGKLRASADANPTNWVFFAVTYDSSLPSEQLKYFFGSASQLATPDVAATYRGGMVDTEGRVDFTGVPTIGNFGQNVGARTATGGSSRVFRGLIDELKVYDTALELADIQSVQVNGVVPSTPPQIVQQPTPTQTAFAGQSVTLRVTASGAAPLNYQWQRNGEDISGATDQTLVIPAAALTDNGAQFRARVSNADGSVDSAAATVTVLEENGHKVSLSFTESGTIATNRGNLGGSGNFVQANGFPVVSGNVPAGPFAPTENLSSVDFGAIETGQGGRAIDFTNNFGNTMGSLSGLTIAGWVNSVNLEDGPGGNRIVFALSAGNGPGFDLVQLEDGSLQLGVNQWPDNTPARSGPIITADPEAGADNWVFFAVTYDGTQPVDNVAFYFGKASQEVQLESTASYDRGLIVTSGALTVGNFSTVDNGARTQTGENSRVFRGLMDEINIFNKVLSPAEIAALQKAPAYRPPQIEPIQITQQPSDATVFDGEEAQFSISFTGTPPISIQWQKDGADIVGGTSQNFSTTATLADNGAQYRAIVSNTAGAVTSQVARLTVRMNSGRKISLSFNEGSGTTSRNAADLGGFGTFVLQDGFPAFSPNIPTGDFAPTNNTFAIDFGSIEDGQGGRAIDFSNDFGNTLGSFDGFTITGWLNSRDLRVGSGGNRIVFGLAQPNGPGLDLVQLADGSLQLGVNQWPDNTPARSSGGMITENPDAGVDNWVFFAVTYDGTAESGNVQFYFGNATQAAQPDPIGVLDYNRGRILTSGPLTVGNFGTNVAARTQAGPNASRVFRGLMDEINIYNKVLSESEIVAAQRASSSSGPTPAPTLAATRNGNQISISWDSAETFQLQATDSLGSTWTNVTTTPTKEGNRNTVNVPMEGGTRFFRLSNNL